MDTHVHTVLHGSAAFKFNNPKIQHFNIYGRISRTNQKQISSVRFIRNKSRNRRKVTCKKTEADEMS